MKLNETEMKTLIAVGKAIQDCTGGEFGYGDEVTIDGVTGAAKAGYISQLVQKNLIERYEYGQLMLTTAGIACLAQSELADMVFEPGDHR